MEEVLRDRFGNCGLGADTGKELPQVGSVHLTAGFLLSEMSICHVEYHADVFPSEHCLNDDSLKIDADAARASILVMRFTRLCDQLDDCYVYLTGDVNYSGIFNFALDILVQKLFIDMLEKTEMVHQFFEGIAGVIERFEIYARSRTDSNSIAANRTIRFVSGGMFSHSE